MEKPKRVKVYWWDITTLSGWKTKYETEEAEADFCVLEGLLVEKNKQFIKVAPCWKEDLKGDEIYADVYVIPRGCIKEIKTYD